MIKFIFIRIAAVGIGLCFLAACSSKPLQVDTDPVGADIFVSAPGQAPRKLGQTPFEIKDSDVGGSSAPLQIVVSKEGYHSSSVLLPGALLGRTGRVSIKMEVVTLPAQCLSQTDSLNKLGRAVAEVQSMIKSKQLETAEKVLTSLIVQYPGLSLVYDLLGNIYYLRRDFDKALVAYRKSISLAPDNSDTQRVIRQIEGFRGASPTNGKIQ
jgi:tetratricopeptide (TPR) repeat protein